MGVTLDRAGFLASSTFSTNAVAVKEGALSDW